MHISDVVGAVGTVSDSITNQCLAVHNITKSYL